MLFRSAVKDEGVDIGKQAVEKIGADAGRLSLVKGMPVEQVAFGRARQTNFHLTFANQIADPLLRFFQRR